MSVRIEVAIPTYRRRETLERALESVAAQERLPEQIVVSDDDCDSSVRELCRRFATGHLPVRYVPHTRTGFMADNWTHAVRCVESGHVALLEDDNYWLPNHLAQAEAALAGGAVLYHAPHHEVHEAREPGGDTWHTVMPPWAGRIMKNHAERLEILMDALTCGSINSSTVVARVDALRNGLPFDRRYPMGMDTLAWTLVAMDNIVACGAEAAAVYTYHGSNASRAEVLSGRARHQARASRRLILSEALARGLTDWEELRHLAETAPPSTAGALTLLLASPAFGPQGWLTARSLLLGRSELGDLSRHLRLGRWTGGFSLVFVGIIDRAAPLWTKLASSGTRRSV
jgi:GT2 family glycosyltransferase